MLLHSAQKMSHILLKQCVKDNDIVVDATMGNGFDTLLLSQLVGKNGKVFAFDIQQQAIDMTTQRLNKHQAPQNYHLILDGHEHVSNYIKEQTLSAAIFNLGYLPQSNKFITTQSHTTITAITSLLTCLKQHGVIIIVVYYGHEGGIEEKESIETFISQLPQQDYHVAKYAFLNQINCPPQLFVIEKR